MGAAARQQPRIAQATTPAAPQAVHQLPAVCRQRIFVRLWVPPPCPVLSKLERGGPASLCGIACLSPAVGGFFEGTLDPRLCVACFVAVAMASRPVPLGGSAVLH
eukprot:TRINITY_DN16425_c0_g1_i1.p3 TRINITY_DN16425_c0_g1~~TRINITY_DN16425_c0_g1_i1.p3  ORF type:complete len:105 (+),score=7.59 TRINITY_DN16425_c0_g1_i1:513-827(+)